MEKLFIEDNVYIVDKKMLKISKECSMETSHTIHTFKLVQPLSRTSVIVSNNGLWVLRKTESGFEITKSGEFKTPLKDYDVHFKLKDIVLS